MGGEFSSVRVVDLSDSIGGSYCAKLLSGAGAEVAKVERPGGAALRSWSSAGPGSVPTGALFSYLHGGHASVTVDTDGVGPLIDGADVVITDLSGPGPDAVELTAGDPSLVVASVTPYGLTGPYAGRPGSELTVQADSGALAVRGHPSRPPIQAGGQSTEWLSGAYAAVGALAALRRRDLTGVGGLVDVSWAEVASLSCTLFADISDSIAGRPDLALRPVARSLETPSIEPTADGYVGFNTNTGQQFSDFLLLIGRPDLLDQDPSWASLGTRMQRWDEWNTIVHEWTTARATSEIVEAAALLRIPAAPVTDARTVLELEHFVEREVFQHDPAGTCRFPRRPWRIDGEEAPPPEAVAAPAPRPPSWGPRPPRPRPDDHDGGAMPCAGLRIVDLTTWWAGPAASGLLAGLGADVIHVESTAHPDGMRMTGGMFAPRDQWWELSGFFLSVNLNKRDVTLDLTTAEGRNLLLDLVAGCDVVMENFSPRVIDRFGLGWDVIRSVNPAAVMVRMPAFGLDGPWRDRPGFAQTMEQVSGLAWLTGHADDQPRIQRGPCDPNAGMHAAFATLTALHRRERTGQGCFVEVPMVEAALAIAAEPVLEWTAYGNLLSRAGNRSARACPQGVFRCRGPHGPGEGERWLALSVLNDAHWTGVVAALGDPVWAKDPELSTWAGRRRREDELESALAEWTAAEDLDEAVATLTAHGVPAAPARDPRRASEHPQFQARGFFEVVDHPVAGRHATPTQPFRLSGVGRWGRTPAPTLGEHNRDVLGALGLGDAELARLEAAGVIGRRPKGF